MTYQMHVLVKLLLLVCLAIVLAHVNILEQTILFLTMVVMAALNNFNYFVNMIRRIRWLLLVLVVIYAFSTPGEYVKFWPIEFSPSYEGIRAGLLQAAKIITVIALLSIWLSTTNKDVLMGGFYQLLRPLRILKIDAEQFAVRLWLTMHYVETQDFKKYKKLSASQVMQDFGLQDATKQDSLIEDVTITTYPLAKLDIFLIVLALSTLGYYFIK
jgi:energy-coupling factor transporter transmembrane protein EcfT